MPTLAKEQQIEPGNGVPLRMRELKLKRQQKKFASAIIIVFAFGCFGYATIFAKLDPVAERSPHSTLNTSPITEVQTNSLKALSTRLTRYPNFLPRFQNVCISKLLNTIPRSKRFLSLHVSNVEEIVAEGLRMELENEGYFFDINTSYRFPLTLPNAFYKPGKKDSLFLGNFSALQVVARTPMILGEALVLYLDGNVASVMTDVIWPAFVAVNHKSVLDVEHQRVLPPISTVVIIYGGPWSKFAHGLSASELIGQLSPLSADPVTGALHLFVRSLLSLLQRVQNFELRLHVALDTRSYPAVCFESLWWMLPWHDASGRPQQFNFLSTATTFSPNVPPYIPTVQTWELFRKEVQKSLDAERKHTDSTVVCVQNVTLLTRRKMRREIVNWKKVAKVIASFNLTLTIVHNVTELSFSKLVHIFRHTDLLIGPHGATEVNYFLLRPGAQVIGVGASCEPLFIGNFQTLTGRSIFHFEYDYFPSLECRREHWYPGCSSTGIQLSRLQVTTCPYITFDVQALSSHFKSLKRTFCV